MKLKKQPLKAKELARRERGKNAKKVIEVRSKGLLNQPRRFFGMLVSEITGALTADNPPCPLCDGPMVLRTARQGTNTGQQFWGCRRFTKGCQGTRPLLTAQPPSTAPRRTTPEDLIVLRCLDGEGPLPIGRAPNLSALAHALRRNGLDGGEWKNGRGGTCMWEVKGEATFWLKVPQGSRDGIWHASKTWFG